MICKDAMSAAINPCLDLILLPCFGLEVHIWNWVGGIFELSIDTVAAGILQTGETYLLVGIYNAKPIVLKYRIV